MSLLCYPLFFFYLLNMFRATMCPSSGADDCVILSPRVGIVPRLQEGCQVGLAGSVSIKEFVEQTTKLRSTNYVATKHKLRSYEAQTTKLRSTNYISTKHKLRSYEAQTTKLRSTNYVATNSSMHTLSVNRSWQSSCGHGTIPTRSD